MKEKFTSIGVPVKVRDQLKLLSAQTGEHMYDIVGRLIKQEVERQERVRYVPQVKNPPPKPA